MQRNLLKCALDLKESALRSGIFIKMAEAHWA